MSFRPLQAVISPEGRTAMFYFMALALPGATGAYFGIWLTDRGLSGGEIGWINSAPIFLVLILNLYVGRIADRAKDWRSVIIAGAVASAVLAVGLFFIGGFWSTLIVMTLVGLPFALVMPVIDAASIRLTRRNGTNFATVRAMGSVGYIVALGATALAVGLFGGQIFLPLLFAIIVLRGGLSLLLPRFRAPAEDSQPAVADAPVATPAVAVPETPVQAVGRLAEVLKPWFVAPIVAFALVQGLHYILGAFSGLIWRANGIDEVWVGPLLALGSISEVIAMLLFKRFAGSFTARNLILFAMLVSTFRWAAMALNPPIWILALLQLTHAATFAVSYLGLMNFIANWTSEDIAAEAQSFATVVQMGVIVVALSGFGYLVDLFGIHAFAAGAIVSVIGIGLVYWSLLSKPASDDAAETKL